MRHSQANQGFSVWEPLTIRHGLNTFNHAETSKSYCSFPFFIWTKRSAPRRLRLFGGPHPTVHSPQWTSSVGAVAVYLRGAVIDHNILHPPPTTPVREGLPPQSTVHNGRHLWGLWQYFFITQQLTFFKFQVDYTGTNLCVTNIFWNWWCRHLTMFEAYPRS